MLKAKESDEEFEELYFLVTQLAALKNYFMHKDLANYPEVERLAEEKSVYNLIKERIDVGEL